MFKDRIDRIQETIKLKRLDFLISTNPSNIFYSTGFLCEEAMLLIAREASFLFVDARYVDEAALVVKGTKVIEIDKTSFKRYLRKLIPDNSKIGYSAIQISCSRLEKWQRYLPKCRFVNAHGILELLRVCKSKEEIDCIRQAIGLTKSAIEHLAGLNWSRFTEKQFSWKIERYLRENGSDAVPFPIIVATGQRSAFPHALARDLRVESSNVLIDLGCRFRYYCSDITRTYLGMGVDVTLKRCKRIVECASRMAIDRIRPGVKLKDIDGIARGYITKQGFGKNFLHSLGHGVGIEVHELPTISCYSKDIAKQGMVFTIEPGVYIKGVGGVRHEQMVMITKNGCEVLSKDIR